jgi:large repetitive protein
VWLLINQGTRQVPRFCTTQDKAPPECLTFATKLVQLAGTNDAVPEWVDWSGDGLPDLMVGKSDGTIDYWWNIGTRTKPAWELKEPRFNIMDAGSFAAPLFADLDGDGVPDLLLAGDREQLPLYTGKAKDPKDPKAGLELWIADDNLLQVRSLTGFDTRAHVATGDLYGNRRQDLVVGTASGQILVYENMGGKDEPSFRTAGGPILPTPQRGFTAPALMDLDGDGLLDIVVGDRNGQLEWIKNAGTKRAPQWKPGGLYYAGIGVGASSVPLFADVDGDGLPDLLVGNNRGQVVYYRNTGAPGAPQFQLTGTRFGDLATAAAASPALFPWNPNQPPDLVVGGQDGLLRSSIRVPGIAVSDRGAFEPLPTPWVNLRARSYSAPAFADLTGIGRPFLLVGTGSGHVLLWRYEGSVSRTEMAKERPRGLNLLADLTPANIESGTPAQATADQKATPGTVITGLAPNPAPVLPVDPVFQLEPSELNNLPVGRHTKPAFFDANGDGKPDLVVGNGDGKLLLFQNLGPADNPKWQLVTSEFAGFNQGRNSAPTFADMDGDGDLDLLVGTEDGQVFYFENVGPASNPKFVYREGALKSLRAGKNAVPLALALDPKGPQLLLGSLRGGLQLFQRKPGDVLDYELTDRRFLGIDLGVNTSPSAADLTQTKRMDLFVGTDKGPITVLDPTGTNALHASGWKTNPSYLAGLPMPAGSHPALVDLDGDGDLDLVVGSDKGPLAFFRNNAIVREGPVAGGGTSSGSTR